MHKQYGGDGLVALSVSLDNPQDEKILADVNAFLRKKEATMTNLIAEGNPDDWFRKLDAESLPLVYVFDRENRRVKKLVGEQVDYKLIEEEVKRLLKK